MKIKISVTKSLVLLMLSALNVQSYANPVCTTNNPSIHGTWETLPIYMPINPISATLLHNGKILIVSGSEYNALNLTVGGDTYRAAVWDPVDLTTNAFSVSRINFDVFCSGVAVLPDGRALIVGGTAGYNDATSAITGDNRSALFDPATNYFSQTQRMVDGRWYATTTVLGDGRVLAFSGYSSSYDKATLKSLTNNTYEIYDPANPGAGWSSPVAAPFTPRIYPRQFLLPNGLVFYTGQGTSGSNGNVFFLNPVTSTWTKSTATTRNRQYGSAVLLPLLPPQYKPVVMNFGGGNPATATTELIDLSVANPVWTPGPNMSSGRVQMNAILLPDGKVLAAGGSVSNNTPNAEGKQADVYDPVSKTFSSGGTAAYSRLYHSTALLLPDARVLSMGSNPGSTGKYEPAIELYTPAYLYDANGNLITTNRPAITSAALGPVGYNQAFSISYSSTKPIKSAVLVRAGSSTHAFDTEQRLVGLCGPAPQPACNTSGTTLNLTSPPNGNIAPPGYYLLFLLDSDGVPSIAQFVHLLPNLTTPPQGNITLPESSTTITAGNSVTFTGSSTSSTDSYAWVFTGGYPAVSSAKSPVAVTYNTPGTYSGTLTVTDANGVTDPSPPSRTITVLPSGPDFKIEVNPDSISIIPGQSAVYNVTVTPLNGFKGTVSLKGVSKNGFGTGITSLGFSPTSITSDGTNPRTSTFRMQATASAQPFAASLTLTGASGTLSRATSTTLIVTVGIPTAVTATPVSSGQIGLSWQPAAGASSYNVKRSLTSGGPYETVGCVTTSSYTDTGLTAGTRYYYVVSARYGGGANQGGESPNSSQVSALAP
jgi:PKD repeat protein